MRAPECSLSRGPRQPACADGLSLADLAGSLQQVVTRQLPLEPLCALACVLAGITAACVFVSSLHYKVALAPLDPGQGEASSGLAAANRPSLSLYACNNATLVRNCLM